MLQEAGFVYVLSSPACPAIKIGGTIVGPSQRLRGINSTAPYGDHGPWQIIDFIQVHDWRHVERIFHTRFKDDRYSKIVSASELFIVSVEAVRREIEALDGELIVSREKIDTLFQTRALASFLEILFRTTGLTNWLHAQGSWTLSLFPSTNGGRYFTINIGNHEVAFATQSTETLTLFNITMDELIEDFPDVMDWINNHEGGVFDTPYKTAFPRSVTVNFICNLADAGQFFAMPGIRRAMTAYWSEALIDWTGRDAKSMHIKSHNYNAVAAICRQIQNRDEVDRSNRQL